MTDRLVCASGGDGRGYDVCRGDSGGSLVCPMVKDEEEYDYSSYTYSENETDYTYNVYPDTQEHIF